MTEHEAEALLLELGFRVHFYPECGEWAISLDDGTFYTVANSPETIVAKAKALEARGHQR